MICDLCMSELLWDIASWPVTSPLAGGSSLAPRSRRWPGPPAVSWPGQLIGTRAKGFTLHRLSYSQYELYVLLMNYILELNGLSNAQDS